MGQVEYAGSCDPCHPMIVFMRLFKPSNFSIIILNADKKLLQTILTNRSFGFTLPEPCRDVPEPCRNDLKYSAAI